MKEEKNALLDWYEEGPGPIGMDKSPMPNPGDLSAQIAMDEPKQIERPKPIDKDKKLEQYGEMYKAMVLTKAIEKKLVNISYKGSDDKDEAKSEIKNLVKKLGEIINGL